MTDYNKQDELATKSVWRDVKCTHIDNIKRFLKDVVLKPELFLDNSQLDKSKAQVNNHQLKSTEIYELEYIIKTYYSDALTNFNKDIKKISPKQLDSSKKTKVNKKKKGLTANDIIQKNLQKQFSLNKFIFCLSKQIIKFNKKSVCDLIYLCNELNKYKLCNTLKYFLDNFCESDVSDIDEILSNLHLWKQQNNNTNFELTKCQKSILSFIINYCKDSVNSPKTILEMSNTGSGKTVGLIIAMGVIWNKILYQNCVSHSFTTTGTRKHVVRFPTKIIIAILPSSVMTFVQTALTSMKVPWAFVTSSATAILEEFNPNFVINYSKTNRKAFQHFSDGGDNAPAIYLTTESPTPNHAIFNCMKSAYKTVFKHIEKNINPDFTQNNYLSYDINSDSLLLGKTGNVYCPFNIDSLSVLIGDDMEKIDTLSSINIFPESTLKIITTATPGGLSKTDYSKPSLPINTYIPSPQDEVRNTGGISLIGSNDYINSIEIAFNHIFNPSNTSPINYKYSMVFQSFINGIFERKYIIPQLYLICSKLPIELKNKIVNRYMFFDNKLSLNINSISIHIMKQFINILSSDQNTILVEILNNFPKNNNNLYNLSDLKSQLCTNKHRGSILCSPNFINNNNDDCELIKLLAGDEKIIYNELEKFNEVYNKYQQQVSKIKQQFNKSTCIDNSSKSDMFQMSSECISDIPIPKFPLEYQLFSNEYLKDYKNSIEYANKISIDSQQILEGFECDDVKLAQGVLSIDPTNTTRLEKALKKYTTGSHINYRCIQLKTDAFNTRQLLLGANPPSKLNIVVANYELYHDNVKTIIDDNVTKSTFPKESVQNLLIQICGRIGRGIDADSHNYIFTTDSVAKILISTTPKTMLFKQYNYKVHALKTLQNKIKKIYHK
jgi:hypothetical protein